MGNTHGMISKDIKLPEELPRGESQPASISLKPSPLSQRIDMSAGGGWQSF